MGGDLRKFEMHYSWSETSYCKYVFIFYNAEEDFLITEDSQANMFKEKERNVTLEELFDYFVNDYNDQLNLQAIYLEVVRIFKELVKNEYKT